MRACVCVRPYLWAFSYENNKEIKLLKSKPKQSNKQLCFFFFVCVAQAGEVKFKAIALHFYDSRQLSFICAVARLRYKDEKSVAITQKLKLKKKNLNKGAA